MLSRNLVFKSLLYISFRFLTAQLLQIASIPGSGNFWILTSESLYFFNPNTSSYVYTAFPTASSDVSHLSTTPSDASKLTLAGPTSIHRCAWSQLSLTCRSVDMADHGPLKATLLLPNGDFYVASDKLYLLPSQSNSFIQVKDNVRRSRFFLLFDLVTRSNPAFLFL